MSLLHENFAEVLTTVEAVEKLEAQILQWAVQGKLVPQNPADEPATILLERITAANARQMKEGIIRKSKSLPSVSEYEKPFDLPPGWIFVRLPALGEVNPRNVVDVDLEASFVPMSLISEEFRGGFSFEERKWSEIKNGYTHFRENDVVVAKITPCFENGKSAIMRGLLNGIGAGTTELHVFRGPSNLIIPEFVYLFFNSKHFRESGKQKMTGTAGQQRVPKDHITLSPFPLPPTAEQHRIVGKVDVLLAQTRAIKERLVLAEDAKRMLNRSAVRHLTEAPDEFRFKTSWRFVREHFELLYRHPENIAELKKAILQLAVQGKLVPQKPNAEPAQELLLRIERKKETLIEQGDIRSRKQSPSVTNADRPTELPAGWRWTRLFDICEHVVDCLHSTPKFTSSGKLCIDTTCLDQSGLVEEKIRFVSEKTFNERIRRLKPREGDILFSREGTIGLTYIVPKNLEVCLGQRMMMFRVFEGISPEFFRMALNSSDVENQWIEKLTGTASKHVNIADIKIYHSDPTSFRTA